MITPQQIITKMTEKETQLCIGLDLKVPEDEKLAKALQIVEDTGELAIAYKPNRQFWLGFTIDQMKSLTRAVKKQDAFVIIDHKLSDIGSTNEAAMLWSKKEGFDLITISPYPGNIESSGDVSKKIEIGLIYLLLMSNPEAKWMKTSPILDWALSMEQHATGVVIGLADYISKDFLEEIAKVMPTPFILAPGMGAQGGNMRLINSVFGKRVMYNVSRGITQANNVRKAAEDYQSLIKSI